MPNTRLHLDSKKRRSSFLYFLLSVMQGFKAVLLDKNRIAMPTRSAELALHTGWGGTRAGFISQSRGTMSFV